MKEVKRLLRAAQGREKISQGALGLLWSHSDMSSAQLMAAVARLPQLLYGGAEGTGA